MVHSGGETLVGMVRRSWLALRVVTAFGRGNYSRLGPSYLSSPFRSDEDTGIVKCELHSPVVDKRTSVLLVMYVGMCEPLLFITDMYTLL
ncbi:hypothetical protein TanjilG_21760 [Lupinus angustifolius]|uniref:Uncharacterized protein n=1 Tax=Lupinus angustifolius TaxID=3871 RepID=A0A1J7FZB3_LUPAN|nr:hypothetical protein TanjilG_21760 [Lupinus angustifolius]